MRPAKIIFCEETLFRFDTQKQNCRISYKAKEFEINKEFK